MERNDFYRYLFLFTAIWNVLVSIPFIFLWQHFAVNFGLTLPNTPLWIELFLWLVFIFGIGYFLVSREITKNHGIVIIGIMTKVLVFLYFTYYLILSEINFMLFGLSVVDLVTACLMIEFLIYMRKNP